MSSRDTQAGFSLLETLVSLALLGFVMTSMASLLIENSKINKVQRLQAQVQSAARTTLTIVSQKLHAAGWDPTDSGIATVGLDPDPGDAVDLIEIFADLNADGDTGDTGESITIRHIADRVEWRDTSTAPWEIIAVGLTNDADNNGSTEPMFVADSSPTPTTITVQVTAASGATDVQTGLPLAQYTISRVVALRNAD